MGQIAINTYFHPYRMLMKRREPVSLTVEVINRSGKETLTSLEIVASQFLAFDKSGLKRTIVEKIGSLGVDEKKVFMFNVWPRQISKQGEYPLAVRVLEHYQDNTYVVAKHTKKVGLRVE